MHNDRKVDRPLGGMEGELIRRERQELSKKMGRAGVRCNGGEVTREADERWRERRGEQREMSRIFHVERAGGQADTETKRAS